MSSHRKQLRDGIDPMVKDELARLVDVDGQECLPVLRYCRGHTDAEDLSYEEWMCPLKLGGDTFALRFELPGDEVRFVEERPMGLASVAEGDSRVTVRVPIGRVRSWLVAEQIDVRPVLRKDTPFSSRGGR